MTYSGEFFSVDLEKVTIKIVVICAGRAEELPTNHALGEFLISSTTLEHIFVDSVREYESDIDVEALTSVLRVLGHFDTTQDLRLLSAVALELYGNTFIKPDKLWDSTKCERVIAKIHESLN